MTIFNIFHHDDVIVSSRQRRGRRSSDLGAVMSSDDEFVEESLQDSLAIDIADAGPMSDNEKPKKVKKIKKVHKPLSTTAMYEEVTHTE